MSFVKRNAYFDGKRFYNSDALDSDGRATPQQKKEKKKFWDLLRWTMSSKSEQARWPKWVENTPYPLPKAAAASDQIDITFINHSTVLIQLAGMNLLTDPIWSERASPFSFVGPKRVRAAGVPLEHLPHIDVILLSHDHYDHLDIPTLKKIHNEHRSTILAGLGVNALLRKHGLECIEMDWWQKTSVAGLEFFFLPAKHWSGRKPFFGLNRTLWGSFLIRSGAHKIYFAGDTAYSTHVTAIAEAFGPMDVALLPIGAYLPRWFMQDNHTNPHESVLMHQQLRSKNSIAIHHSTFCLSDEPYDAPLKDLQKALLDLKAVHPFHLLDVGQSITFSIDQGT